MERTSLTHLAHDLVVGIHLSAKSYHHAAIQSTKESSKRNKAVLTMRLGVAHLDLEEAFGYAIHLLNLARRAIGPVGAPAGRRI